MIRCHGVDETGDVLVELSCGHVRGYALITLQGIARLRQGTALRHTECGCTELVSPQDLRAMLKGLQTAA